MSVILHEANIEYLSHEETVLFSILTIIFYNIQVRIWFNKVIVTEKVNKQLITNRLSFIFFLLALYTELIDTNNC